MKNKKEKQEVETKKEIIEFIEKSFSGIKKHKKEDFKKKSKLNRYVIKTILKNK